jgi:hypothetical protein
MQAADTLRSCLYRAAPVFGAPPCPVELAADCVALGSVAVDDVGLRFIAYAIAATTSMTTTRALMPHAARRPGSVDVRGGRWVLRSHTSLLLWFGDQSRPRIAVPERPC